MVKLIDLLKESFPSPHYRERRRLRSDIINISLDKGAYEGYDFNELKSKLIPLIQNSLSQKLKQIEGIDYGGSHNHVLGKVVLKPYIENKGTKYPITIEAKDKNGTSIGKAYFVVIDNNTLVTLLLIPDDSPRETEDRLRNHIMRKGGENQKDIKIIKSREDEVVYNIDKIFGKESQPKPTSTVQIKDLPYDVKTDYRKGSKFNHKDYGTGTVVTTSQGTRGVGNAQGKLDWVEVDFGKPYLKGGELHKTRKIPNIYTSVHFNQ